MDLTNIAGVRIICTQSRVPTDISRNVCEIAETTCTARCGRAARERINHATRKKKGKKKKETKIKRTLNVRLARLRSAITRR